MFSDLTLTFLDVQGLFSFVFCPAGVLLFFFSELLRYLLLLWSAHVVGLGFNAIVLLEDPIILQNIDKVLELHWLVLSSRKGIDKRQLSRLESVFNVHFSRGILDNMLLESVQDP